MVPYPETWFVTHCRTVVATPTAAMPVMVSANARPVTIRRSSLSQSSKAARFPLPGPELMLVIDGVCDAPRAVDMIEHARPDILRYAEPGQVSAYGSPKIMDCGVGNA